MTSGKFFLRSLLVILPFLPRPSLYLNLSFDVATIYYQFMRFSPAFLCSWTFDLWTFYLAKGFLNFPNIFPRDIQDPKYSTHSPYSLATSVNCSAGLGNGWTGSNGALHCLVDAWPKGFCCVCVCFFFFLVCPDVLFSFWETRSV